MLFRSENIEIAPTNISLLYEDGIVYSPDKMTIYASSTSLSGELVIPDTVMEIADGAFAGAKISKVVIPAGFSTVGRGWFMGCSELTEVVFHERIDTIDAEAFKDCTKLQSITIPRNVTTIGESAFEGCSQLSDITFEVGSEVLNIRARAFKDCVALESITIPARVRSIQYARPGTSSYTYYAAIEIGRASCRERV